MSNLNREIESDVIKIYTFVKERLSKDKIIIPTFQREFVWEPENILKLWDSIFRFYPIGSILYWVTDSYLHTHRKLGGFEFPHDEDTIRKFKEWSYILDGQQRATSLLVSLLGGKGKIKDNSTFDYTLYFDATKAEFFFANELDKKGKRGSGLEMTHFFNNKQVLMENVSFQDPKALLCINHYHLGKERGQPVET